MADVPKPCEEQVEKYLVEWKKLENYVEQERSLKKLFHDMIPENKKLEDILIKTCALNTFYSTHLYSDVFPMAKHIYELDIDKRLEKGDLTLVEDIVSSENIEKKYYSFASKYCSHHNPDDFPIYDYFVDKVLRVFRNNDKFTKFRNDDLKDYPKFKEILLEFQEFYSIDNYNLKELDRYLWLLGKEYFPRKKSDSDSTKK